MPTDHTYKKTNHESDDSPNDTALTHDGSEYGHNFLPLSLSFSEKEKVYVLVQWKLQKLLNSQSEEKNVISPVRGLLTNSIITTGILPFASTRQEAYYLLLCLSKKLQKFVTNNQAKLAPFFIEG